MQDNGQDDEQHDYERGSLTFTQVYSIASTARLKLRTEADLPEHNLRRLVAHANLLDRKPDSNARRSGTHLA